MRMWWIFFGYLVAFANPIVQPWDLLYARPHETVFGFSGSLVDVRAQYAADTTVHANVDAMQADGQLTFMHGIADRASFFLRGNWRILEQRAVVPSGLSYGLGDQSGGTTFVLMKDYGPMRALYAQLQVDVPCYDNRSYVSHSLPALGSQSIDTSVGMFADFELSQLEEYSLQMQLGFASTYRTAGYTPLMPWLFKLGMYPKKFGIFGNVVLRGSNAMASSVQIDGVSALTQSYSPSILLVGGQLGHVLSSALMLRADFQLSVFGIRAPALASALLTLQWTLGVRQKDVSVWSGMQEFEAPFFQALVVSAHDRLNLVKIDKGSQNGIEVGQVFDFFVPGTSESIAEAKVSWVHGDESALEIIEYYREVAIEEGFVARRKQSKQ